MNNIPRAAWPDLRDMYLNQGMTRQQIADHYGTTMYRIDQQHLLWVLDAIAEGRSPNVISVHPEAKRLAKLAFTARLAGEAGIEP